MFSLSLIGAGDVEAAARGDLGRVLFGVRYGAPRAATSCAPFPLLDVPNAVLGDGPSVELWLSAEPVVVQRRGAFSCAADGTVFCGAAAWPLTDDLEADTLELYRELLGAVADAGYPALQRLWHYVPDINGHQRGVERYKRFSAGRARGIEERLGTPVERHFPASSAVGTTGDALAVCVLAARERGRHVENPRQVSAYRYPPQYGATSPSFARGTLAPRALGEAFFLSGTASVVGHESRHVGDVLRQLDETLRNIETLVATVRAESSRSRPGLPRFDYLKTYIRRPSDFPAVRAALAQHLDPGTTPLWLVADICRAELLLEIDGLAL